MHQPVLLAEVVANLVVRPGGRYLDATVGGGGHAAAILGKAGPDGRLLGLDRDPIALDLARATLAGRFPGQWILQHGNFADMTPLAAQHGWLPATCDGVLLDLGVSSMQLDTPERGFSFRADGPLDMRMNPTTGTTAADVVNTWPEDDLADVMWRLGEEPASRRIARAIGAARARAPIRSTAELAAIVERAKGGRSGRLHPATQAFQALRMVVNGELEAAEAGVEAAIGMAKPGGRVAVISFHSLEDRIVKRAFAAHVGRAESLQGGGEVLHRASPPVAWVVRTPVTASEDEVAANPRARSAKLRVVERIDGDGA